MSVSIDLYFYNRDELLQALQTWGMDDRDLGIRILEACGTFIGDTYVLLNNEYYGDNSPYYRVASLFDSAFNKEDSFSLFLGEGLNRTEGVTYADEDDIAERLGITLTDGDDDEC